VKINLLDVYAIDSQTNMFEAKIINLYPYLVHALDIYFTCNTTESYNWVMSKSQIVDQSTGLVTNVPKFSVALDGIVYPIMLGEPGETFSNPITFERPVYNLNLVKGNTVGYLGTSYDGFVETPIEKDENTEKNNVVPVGTSNFSNDFIPFKLIVNDPAINATFRYPYGGATADELTQYDGFGGVMLGVPNVLVEGYGGVKPNPHFVDINIIIEKSKFKDDLNNRETGIGVQDYGIRY